MGSVFVFHYQAFVNDRSKDSILLAFVFVCVLVCHALKYFQATADREMDRSLAGCCLPDLCLTQKADVANSLSVICLQECNARTATGERYVLSQNSSAALLT